MTILLFNGVQAGEKKEKWVGTWYTAPQLVETNNNPPSPGLTNNTLRQIVHVSIGGETLRVRFTNEFSASPVVVQEARIAVSLGGGSIDTATNIPLTFNGSTGVTIPARFSVTSDPVSFPLQPLSDVALTIYFGQTPSDLTGHPGSRTTSYIWEGNRLSSKDATGSVTTDHWYIIQGIEVLTSDSTYAVVTLGNSITDGRGSGTNKQNRWPDELARRFYADSLFRNIGVLNAGIGGNCVLSQCLGPSALSRFERDVLNQYGVRWLIILEGINDIGNSQGSGIADRLIDAYKQMITMAHARGIYVYGGTILPMKGSFYYTDTREAERQKVNQWIRTSGLFDGVIDFDKALRNPADTLSLLPDVDTGDHLHPNETGYQRMAAAIDLSLFLKRDSLAFEDRSWKKYFEAECGTLGSNWDIISDTEASNGAYVTVKASLQSTTDPPVGAENLITIPFTVDSTLTYHLSARINCPTYNDDSFWIKMDNGNFQLFNNLVTNGWEWKKLGTYPLSNGDHTVTIAYREDGAKLDKLFLSVNDILPVGMGETAENLCVPTSMGWFDEYLPKRHSLKQNFPNPFNSSTYISFVLPSTEHVRITVYDVLGKEITRILDEARQAGTYCVTLDASSLPSGVYLYKFETSTFSETRKFVLMR